MSKLLDKYYDAIVITDEVDPNKQGAVRVRIIGVTDGLADDEQPFAVPAVGTSSNIPYKGYHLKVEFDEGDPNRPKYTSMSAERNVYPQESVSGYPNVVVANLGGDFFNMVHDRKTKISAIQHPSNSKIIWNARGQVIHDSDKAYSNAGFGALNNAGVKIHSVLTEATIDIFCCTPVGNAVASGGAYQGSEYMFVSHIAKDTVDAINSMSNSDFDNTFDPVEETGENSEVLRDITDSSGNIIGSVDFIKTETFIQVGKEKVTAVIICNSGNNDFISTVSSMLSGSNNGSVHYVIGTDAGSPDLEARLDNGNKDTNITGGFVQLVELEDDATFASNAINPQSDESANKSSVIIMLIGDGTKTYSAYQYETINKVVNTVRFKFNEQAVEVLTVDELEFTGSKQSMGLTFLKTKIG